MSDAPVQKRRTAAPAMSSKTYWRSFDQLADTPEFREILRREFPEGVSEHSGLGDPVSRRRFLGVVAASVALAGLTSCRKPGRKILPFNRRPDGMVPGIPEDYATAHERFGYAIGQVVRVHDGRPNKIEGNPRHPASLGGTDSWMQAEILQLYDPGRSQHVLHDGHALGVADDHDHGHGGHGEAAAEAEDPLAPFLEDWNAEVTRLAGRGGAGLRVLMPPSTSPTRARLVAELQAALPQAVVHHWSPLGEERTFAGSELAFGAVLNRQLDLTNAAVVAAFDDDFLGSDARTLAPMRTWADSRRIDDSNFDAVVAGEASISRLYVAEACYTVTGSNADHRLRLSDSELADAVFALAAALGVGERDPALQQALAAFAERGFPTTFHRVLGDAAEGTRREAVTQDWIATLAADLEANRGRSAVLVGFRQPPVVHAVAHAINVHLGNVSADGSTPIGFTEVPPGIAAARGPGIAELVEAMRAGEVETLVCIDSNPVLDAPADLGFAEAFARVGRTVHLGLFADETARAATWHVPMAHELERWGDLLAWDGTAAIVQPLIAPLYAPCLSPVEFLARLIQADESEGYLLVQATWRDAAQGDFDRWWTQALHDGLVADSAAARAGVPTLRTAAIAEALAASRPSAPPSRDALEIAIRPDPSVLDGRYANNPWMQELPTPVDKLCWDNAVLVSRATADALEVRTGDVVELGFDGRSVRGPIWIQPGHADHVLTVTLGQGRQGLEVAEGCGFDAYPLLTAAHGFFARGVQVRKTGDTYALVTTQDHGSMEGRPLVREASLETFRANPDFGPGMSPLARIAAVHNALHHGNGHDHGDGHDHDHDHGHGEHGQTEADLLKSLWDERQYTAPYQWGMSIDLNACTGCLACVVACVAENNIPMVGKAQIASHREMFWIRVDRYFQSDVIGESGEADNSTGISLEAEPRIVHQVVPCMQCENAPCEAVCPVAATVHSPEGLNDMAYNRCIGTRYCSNNCPYKVRRFNWFNFNLDPAPTRKMQFNPDVTVRHRGVMEKCTYCVQRISAARLEAKKAGSMPADLGVQTACQQACPTEAIAFGNLRDPESRVTKLKKTPRDYALLSELNTKPRTTYLAKVRNPNPELS